MKRGSWMVMAVAAAIVLVAGIAEAKLRHESAVFVVDVSGTMKDMGAVGEAQRLVQAMNARFPNYVKSAGLLAFGRLRPAQVEWLAPVETYSREEINRAAGALVGTDGPTPLGSALRKCGEGLEQAVGRTALIIISDGRDTGFTDPVEVMRELKKKHGNDVCVFTIQMGDDKKGGELLAELVKVGECGKTSTAQALKDERELQSLVDYIFPPEERPLPPPPKPYVPPPPQDSDGDGVIDPLDECPDTPRGARVDARGCWVLRDVKFDFDKAEIKPEYYPYLNEVVGVLQRNPELKVIIEGHTDGDGSDQYNLKLSQKRAEAVRDYFVSQGIDPSRLTAVGFGKTRPIASNDTPEGKAENRRIELSVQR